MVILGLAGQAGAGKDVVADYLVSAYGFVKFAFSDALYAEVQKAFGLEDQSLLRDRATKELPTSDLSLDQCSDPRFAGIVESVTQDTNWTIPRSPRQILQWWGTDYRRAHNPNYWLDKAEDFVFGLRAMYQYPEQAPQHFVECGTRFENEREWIHSGAHTDLFNCNVWHIRRAGLQGNDTHSSATELPVLEQERELFNNDTIERLHRGIDLLLTTQAKFVRVEPMLASGIAPVVNTTEGDK